MSSQASSSDEFLTLFGQFAPIRGGQSFQAELVRALSLVLDIEGESQMYHSWRVGTLSAMLAENLKPDLKEPIMYAGFLHDIGALGIDDHIANHPGQEEQVKIPWIKAHPLRGAEIIGEIPGMWDTVPFVLDHHERWDGRGYPRGFSGNYISLGAQMLKSADSAEIALRRFGKADNGKFIERIASLGGSETSHEVGKAVQSLFSDKDFTARWSEPKLLHGLVDKMLSDAGAVEVPLSVDEISAALRIFALIIDCRHKYTAGHSQRVSRYGLRLALGLGLDRGQVLNIREAGYLHDLGKVSVPSSLLDKPASLSEHEYARVKNHPLITIEVLSTISALSHLAPIAGGHHEHFDGSGYPYGLSGEKIPLEARILAVADAFDALTSDRAYRNALEYSEAVRILEEEAGSHFDPNVTAAAHLLVE